MTLHPKYQGSKYRVFRAMMFVATGLCGVAPLIHGIKVFGMSQMMKKAFPYTMAKAGCLLSGTAFYSVSLPNPYIREKKDLTQVILRPGIPKVDILANLIYGARIRSSTS
jgi:adiponectin receptor